MMQVWKFPLVPAGWVRMPTGARLLHVNVQNGEPYVWAEVDPEAKVVERRLPIFGTGHDIICLDEDGRDLFPRYVGTFHLVEDGLVFHVYDAGEFSGE